MPLTGVRYRTFLGIFLDMKLPFLYVHLITKRTKEAHIMKTLFVLLAGLSFMAFSVVLADGPSRPATQAEKDFTKSVLDVFAKAVPPGPKGWDRTNDSTVIKELERVTDGAEKQPLQVHYCMAWQNTKDINSAWAKLNADLAKLAKKPGVSGKEIEQLAEKMAPHDVKVRIDLNANVLSEGIYGQIDPAPAIAGGLVCRSQAEYRANTGWREGSTYVFLGKDWKMDKSTTTYVNFSPDKNVSHTAVQSIVVKVQADSNRAQQILQEIDWEALKKLIR